MQEIFTLIHSHSRFIDIVVECSANLLNRYYSLADRVSVLYAAVALDPDTKLRYFEIEWCDHPDWILLATTKSKYLWTMEYRTLQYIDTTLAQPSPTPTASTGFLILPDDTLSRWKQKNRARLTHGESNQFDRFQAAEEEEEVPDILAYWAAQLNNPRWSQLAHMALEIHCIPAMRAEVARAFSR